jgi:hypothetical protein
VIIDADHKSYRISKLAASNSALRAAQLFHLKRELTVCSQVEAGGCELDRVCDTLFMQ